MSLFLGDVPGTFAGMLVRVIDAQEQRRTARDVCGPWVRPKVPVRGKRWGTRRMWKRRYPPHYVMLYREPEDVLVIDNRTIIATPRQADTRPDEVSRCR